jgi:hypothetical protein
MDFAVLPETNCQGLFYQNNKSPATVKIISVAELFIWISLFVEISGSNII